MARIRERKQVSNRNFSAGTQYTEEFQGRIFDRINVWFSSRLTADGTGVSTVFTDPLLKMLGSAYEIIQGETPLLRLTAQELFWLCAFIEGAPGIYDMDNSIGASATADQAISAGLDLTKLFGPFGAIDARTDKVFFRGTFGAVTAYSANVASAAGVLKHTLRTSQRADAIERGYIRPNIYKMDADLSVASTERPLTIRFQQDVFLPGLLLITRDDSGGGSTANANAQASRANGLIRNVRLDIETAEENGEIFRSPWEELWSESWSRTGFAGSSTDTEPLNAAPQGVAWIPLVDQTEAFSSGGRAFKAGDSLTIFFDTASTAIDYFTAVTPASGDLCHVVIPAGVPVNRRVRANEPGNAANVRSSPLRVRRGPLG